ncbi:MAG: ribosome biogenesis GTPase Der [bacterium]
MLAKKISKQLPTIVIFGRTNVGKSTLFNCLIEKKQALVSNIEGTTRDSNFGKVIWQKHVFNLIDTGGFIDFKFLADNKVTARNIDEQVQKQARELITRADLVLFLVDNKTGLLPQDKIMAQILRKIMPEKKKIILVANKVDNFKQASAASDFYAFNLGKPETISATTGSGTGDLLDLIVEKIDAFGGTKASASVKQAEEEKEEEKIKVCIIGKPNVGKSSLLNAILGYNRVLVSPIAHTTREPQNTDLVYKGENMRLIDTAGINKKGIKAKTKIDQLEKGGIRKSLQILQQSDIVLLVLDINEPITHQDAKLVEEIFKQQKSLILVANKWDLIKERDTKTWKLNIYRELPFAQFVPIQFTSAKYKEKVNNLMDLILEIDKGRKVEIGEARLDRFIKQCIKRHKPTKGKGMKYPRIFKFKQEGSNPPNFVVKIGANENLADSYLHFIANQLRDEFGFLGTPLNIWVEKARSVHGTQLGKDKD